MEDPYNRKYEIHPDSRTSELFKSFFRLPLPMSGSAISKLSDTPMCTDHTSAFSSRREVSITTWNTQCHHYPTSFGYTIEAPVMVATPPRRQDRTTVLIDGALSQVVSKIQQINAVTRRRILEGKGVYITTLAARLDRLPKNYLTRSSTLTDGVATDIARAFDEGRLTTQTSELPPGSSETGEAVVSGSRNPPPEGRDESTNTGAAATAKPGKSAAGNVVPVREVRAVAMAIKGYTPVQPPRSAPYTAIEAYASNADRAATQPYLPAARGVLARDIPSIQEIISYTASYNASYIDTAPALRGLLYVYPLASDVWKCDSFESRFVRRMKLDTRRAVGTSWFQVLPADRVQIRLVAVTLPAFSAHLKSLDPGMKDVGADGIPLLGMDTAWAAVPLSSDMLSNPWLLEYLLMFLPTAMWAGKMCRLSRAQHTTDANDADAYYTGMPAAHQVHIPAPTKLVLVLLDESTYAQAGQINLPGVGNMNVYRGVRIAHQEAPFNTFWVNAQDAFYALFTNAAYEGSCQHMVTALQYMESALCTSYAFQLALTLAAEIASYLPESPHLHGDERGQYEDELGGGWTIGAHNFNIRHPFHTTSNINEGAEEVIRARVTRLLHGFSFGAVSPMQQHAHNYATIAHGDVIADGNYVGTETHWLNQVPDLTAPQYQCNVANSAYRVLLGLDFILKNDISYGFRTPDGLSNVTTMQGVCLSLSLGLSLVRSDVSRRQWSGISVNADNFTQTPIRNWVSDMTLGMVLMANADSVMARAINGNFTISNEIDMYYGLHPGNEDWGAHVCMPYASFLQWAKKFEIDMVGEYLPTHGVINAEVSGPHLLINDKNGVAVSWLGTSQDSHSNLPVVYMGHCNAVPYMVAYSIEDWQIVSCGAELVYPVPAGMMSNLFTLSINNRYRNNSRPGSVMVVNKHAMIKGKEMWDVSPLSYPDPPNSDFLQRLGPADVSGHLLPNDGIALLEPQQIEAAEVQADPPQEGAH